MAKRRRILFLSEGEESASTRYRALAYFERLRGAGFEPRHFQVTGLWRRVGLLAAVRGADVVVSVRKMFRPAYWGMLRGGGRKLVFDFDDALFGRDDGEMEGTERGRFFDAVRSVDVVWAGNGLLAEVAGRVARVEVLPTSVGVGKYAGPSGAMSGAAGASPAGEGEKFFDVVWIGSSSTRKYLEGVMPALAAAAKEIPKLRLKIVADFDLEGRGVRTLAVKWSEAGEAEALRSSQVGIAPLPDNGWTRGKCGLKIVQYMAAGIPVVASPVGVQTGMVQNGGAGLLAESEADWVAALKMLAGHGGLRGALGEAGRKYAAAEYSVDATFGKMLASLDGLLGM